MLIGNALSRAPVDVNGDVGRKKPVARTPGVFARILARSAAGGASQEVTRRSLENLSRVR